jgi:hypothetical protein
MDTSNDRTGINTITFQTVEINPNKNETTNLSETTYTNLMISENTVTPKENSTPYTSTHPITEKALNDKTKVTNQSETPYTDSCTHESMETSNEIPTLTHANIFESQEFQVNYKISALESTCPSSPLSPKIPPLHMEI